MYTKKHHASVRLVRVFLVVLATSTVGFSADGQPTPASEPIEIDDGRRARSVARDVGAPSIPDRLVHVARGCEGEADETSSGGAPPVLEIAAIQGSGLESPIAGLTVTTEDNIVTSIGPEGFFIQTPDARADDDPDTSEGLYIFTGDFPTVTVGNQVDVTGTVIERFDLTQIDDVGLIVSVDGTGLPLPTPIAFDADTPSPDQPQSPLELERFENMLVEIANGRYCSPQGFSPEELPFVISTPRRCLREAGIRFPGVSGLPIWDGNPEVLLLNPSRNGDVVLLINGGSTIEIRAILGHEFGVYQLWPRSTSSFDVALPRVVRSRLADEMTIGSLNLQDLFDNIDDPPGTNALGEARDDIVVTNVVYARERAKLAAYIVEVLDSPDVLAVQEVEKLEVLQALGAEIAALDATIVYTAHLFEGNDQNTIDVGFLVRDTISGVVVDQLGKDEVFTFDGVDDLTHDRPPLRLQGIYGSGGADFDFALLGIHNRSRTDVGDPVAGPRVRAHRLEQAQSVAAMVQSFQDANPAVPLIVVGDFNAFEFSDGYVDVVGQIAGDFDPTQSLLSGPDLVEPDLEREVLRLSPVERYSAIVAGNAVALDHALTNAAAAPLVTHFAFGRGNPDAPRFWANDIGTPRRASDRDGLVVYLTTIVDPVFEDGFESGSTAAWDVTVP